MTTRRRPGRAWAALSAFSKTAVRHRLRMQAGLDGSVMGLSVLAATLLRYDMAIPPDQVLRTLAFAAAASVVFVVCGVARGLYAGRWSFGAFEEVLGLVTAIVAATAVMGIVDVVAGRPVPLSVPLIAGTIVLCLTGALRYSWRLRHERQLRPTGEVVQRVVVIGAGEGAQHIITAMLRNPSGRFLPVAVIDDDPAKANLQIRGVKVSGRGQDLAGVARRHDAEVALLAIPSADSTVVWSYADAAAEAGLQLLVLPSVSELYGAQVGTADIRPVTHADLLGRHEVDTDIDAIAGYVTGRRVLVTGAGGSIGSELCRQLYQYAPESLVLLDRDESALHAVQLSLEGRALLDSRNLVVADIRDGDRVEEVFAEHRPEVVFHAAALKHLPLLEMHPCEALKTNVWGTRHLLDAAIAHGTDRFVNVSTDKAADPTSVLGYTKRLAERITAHAAGEGDGVFISVRFGNVLGSRGSVLTTFAAQIEAGGPVTVTDPEVTRYFMTVEEAVQLVIQAGAVGRDGEALVLDMGEPVLIDQVARRLVADSDRPIDVVYTGLRPGEKRHEVLFSTGEVGRRLAHPRISHVDVPALPSELLPDVRTSGPDEHVVAAIREACVAPASQPSPVG